jgi:hypothetical protein
MPPKPRIPETKARPTAVNGDAPQPELEAVEQPDRRIPAGLLQVTVNVLASHVTYAQFPQISPLIDALRSLPEADGVTEDVAQPDD